MENKILEDILKTVTFLKDNTVTKQEFNEFRDKTLTKQEFNDTALTKEGFEEFRGTTLTKEEFRGTTLTKQEFRDTAVTKQEFNELFEIVTFIKDNAASREDLTGLATKEDLAAVDKRLSRVESEMATKEYIDNKFADWRGDMVSMTRKEDIKLKTLVNILGERKVITAKDQKKIFALEPFARV